MKYILITVIFQIFSLQLFAETLKTQIEEIEKGNSGAPHLAKLSNGHVAFVESKDEKLLQQIKAGQKRHDWLELTLDDRHTLLAVKTIIPGKTGLSHTKGINFNDPYEPTVMTLTRATNIFRDMRRGYTTESQCFNRAHVWVYEEFKRNGTNLNKVFLFFTSRYIRTYRFGWWFHVTPMAYVGGTNNSNMRMLDRKYTTGPLTSKTWTDIFINSKRTCPIVREYSDYHDNQQSQDCYLIPVSMYYLVPSDLDRLERNATERKEFDEEEVSYAFFDGFGIE